MKQAPNQPPSQLLYHAQLGAMFGLDARIALAIFGILSVVAGVTGLSIFGQTNVTALATELNNMKKAYTEFHMATGENTLRFLDLIDNSSEYPGWNGPYIDGLVSDRSRSYGVYSLVEGRMDVPGVPPVECTGGICATWLKLTKVKDNLAQDVDKFMDAEPGANTGVLRIELTPGATDDIYFLIATKPGSTKSE